MRIAIGSDHRGFTLKGRLVEMLGGMGHEVTDVGADSAESSDYPDYAAAVARQVSRGEADRGVLVCGSSIGMCIAANKFPGVRAGTCNDELTAEISRRHNDLNVLCLSGDVLGQRDVEPLLRTWLDTAFEGGRHARRVDKITAIEKELAG